MQQLSANTTSWSYHNILLDELAQIHKSDFEAFASDFEAFEAFVHSVVLYVSTQIYFFQVITYLRILLFACMHIFEYSVATRPNNS